MSPRRPGGALLLALAAAISIGIAPIAHAQPAPAPATVAVAVAPKLKAPIAPTYPPERLAKGEEADVVLSLLVDATGKVVDVKVVESGGDDFDAAAIEAAKKLDFEPATVDGKPSPAKIPRFRVPFRVPKTTTNPTPVEAPKPIVNFSGAVRGPGDQPLAGATVTVVAGDGKQATTSTDALGKFYFTDLPDGTYQVHVDVPGFTPFVQTESLQTKVATEVVYRPAIATTSGADIVIVGEKPPREVVKRVLEADEIKHIPGTNGDAIRALQNLPGVGRSPGFFGFLLVRGSAPQDTNYFIDGVIVPNVFHFGGLSSVVPAEMLDRIDFYPGNFGPEFGRVMGGIVDVGLKSPARDRWHGLLQFDLLDGRTVIEGPIDDKTRVAVGARRSWVDAWLGPVLRKTGTGVSTAPVYYDYQLIVERDLSSTTTARASFYGSDDRLALTLNSPNAADPALGGDVSTHSGFVRGEVRVETKASKNVTWTNTFAVGKDFFSVSLGEYFLDVSDYPLILRSDVRAKVSHEAQVIVGLDGGWAYYDVGVKVPPFPPPGEAPGPFFARPAPELHGRGGFFRPGAYAMLDLSPVHALHLLPGVRVDYTRDTSRWDVSPRFVARLDVVPEFPKTTLKGAIGIFQQPPLPQQSLPPFGTPGLRSQRATHYDVGVEQEITRQFSVTLDGWYKELQGLVTVQQSASTTANQVTYGNTSVGRAFGIELLARYKSDAHFFGWIAYTLSRSERRDVPGHPWHLFQYDQTHILTALGSYKLGKGWQVGARFRYVSGPLYTPMVGGVSDFDAGAYQPIPSFPQFTARLPAFHQLDIRVDKEWRFTDWTFAVYLDVQNVYNRQNPETLQYNYNYSQSTTVSFLPILPILGVRGEL